MIISAHSWMGLKSVEALETLLKFISRKFINRHKLITKEQAINLYSVMARRVNGTSLDLTSLESNTEPDNNSMEVEFQLPPAVPLEDQELLRVVGEIFLELHDVSKISNILIRKYGVRNSWEAKSIQIFLRQIISGGLNKLKSCRKRGPSPLVSF